MNTNINNNIRNVGNNISSVFTTPRLLTGFAVLIIFLIIMLLLLIFKVKFDPLTSSQQQITGDVFVIVFFVLIIVLLCFTLLPNFKEVRDLFSQISNVVYVILYTIFLILFFTLMPSDTLNNYAYIITPITALLGVLSFYKATTANYVDIFNINYERIKMMIITFCLITCYIIFYNTDPGGYISQYFGYTLLLTIVTSVFAFIYLVTLLTLPENSGNQQQKNFLNNFSKRGVYSSILFVIFLIIMTALIYTNQGGILDNQSKYAGVVIIVLIISILWCTINIFNLFPEITNKAANSNTTSLIKRSLLIIFGFIVSGLIIYWLTNSIQNLSGQSSIVSFILNLVLVIIILGLIYKAINVQSPSGNSKKSGFINLILNLLFYIPCLFTGTFDAIGKTAKNEYNNTTYGSFIALFSVLGIYLVYFIAPYIYNYFSIQGGDQLVNKPVYTDTQYNLGTYQDLNGGSDEYDYQYSLSFWVFIDAAPPNTNPSYETYTSILNFANKPNVLYNGSTNTLMITMMQQGLQDSSNNSTYEFDTNGNRIVYINDNFLLQKWNNIILNYNGGFLDIFLNGELVKSNIDVVPYYTLDSLTIGQDSGIKGGICNVVYFRKPLTQPRIYYLYNIVKDKNPPTTNESNTTILINNTNTLSSSINTTL
jgi:hypothetical protein